LNGDARTAVSFLQRAMDAAIAARLSAESALWAGNLANAHASLRHWDDAERFNNEAQKLSAAGSRAVRPVYFTLNAAEISAGRGQNIEADRLFKEALAASEGIPSVVWSAHAGLAGTAMAAGQPEIAAQHFESALDTIEKTRSNLLKTEFRLSFLTQLIEFYRSYVDALLAQNRFERALEIAESSRARVLAERHGTQAASTADARSLRRLAQQSGTVLLSYWLAPNRSSMWIVSGERIQHVPLPSAREIEDLVEKHQSMIHNTLANPLAGTGTPGRRLFGLLVAPALSRLKPGASVVIVPDGALHRLNFETLVAGGSQNHYWIEDAEIQIAPSLTVLAARERQRPPRRSLLLIGDPTAREPEFPALRYAPAEMANIIRHFPQAAVYRSENAVPGAYRDAELDRFAMIHFTAHAFASTESPLDSAIMLSGPDHAFKLYARDVAERPLTAELVTVSACRSAGERTYSGEGLVGFSWAFLRAGARRVIAGLWDVDDRSTAELMDDMYGRIASGIAPPRALRGAKLAVLGRGGTTAKPYYWAPFEVFTATTSN
jgi:CHAT domain-containing protein